MSEEEQKIYNIYLLAKKDGYTGTYEQWLASIKGADGVDGKTPFIGDNGNWWIGTTDTGVRAGGKDGTDGKDGADGKDGTNGTNGTNGKDGKTPFIGDNGNWWIGTTDTGIKANGADGTNGTNGANGADGTNGKDGKTPFIGDNGNWWIGTTDTGVKANGKDGTNGADGTNGKDGSSILSGSGVPNATLGNDGDTYIDVSTGDTYKKTTGSWTKIGNINGECEHEYIPSINLEYKVYGSSVYITHTYTCANCSKEIHLPEDTPVVSFKKGKGTEASPFLISNSDDFSKLYKVSDALKANYEFVKDGFSAKFPEYYYKMTADISFQVNDSISAFVGHLDGGNHKLTLSRTGEDLKPLITDLMGNVEFKNLDLLSDNVVLSAYHGYSSAYGISTAAKDGSLSFNNVNILSGSKIENGGTNDSFYVACGASQPVSFTNCKNSGSITGTAYMGAFLGGYVDIGGNLSFTNCEFAGVMRSVYAGMLIGNESRLTQYTLSVNDCKNTGSIIGINKSGLLSSCNISNAAFEDYRATYIGEGKVVNAGEGACDVSNVGLSLAKATDYNSSRHITASCTTNTDVSYYVVKAKFYATLDQGDGKYGTSLTTVYSKKYHDISKLTDIYRYKVIDCTDISSVTMGNDTTYNDGTNTYFIFKAGQSYGNYSVIFDKDSSITVKDTVKIMVYAYDSSNLMIGYAAI